MFLVYLGGILAFLYFTNFLSYRVLKNKTLNSKKWDLNICCGKTDGGGINADIKKHDDIPNFVLVDDIYNLPFKDKQFKNLLCSHTIEHVDSPVNFYNELKRIGKNVTIVIPPLWDLSGVFNILEHRSIFLSFNKNHSELPKFISLPFSDKFQNFFGQKIKA